MASRSPAEELDVDGVAVRMSVLYGLLGGSGEAAA